MEIKVRYLADYIRSGSKLVIPVYQRNYEWTQEQCENLLQELIAVHEKEKESHFLGIIVVKPGDTLKEDIILSGHQGLMTVSLLTFAVRNILFHKETNDKLASYETFFPNNPMISSNYQFFQTTLKAIPISGEKLLEALQKLQVVVVSVEDQDDDLQSVFDRLSTTGVGLSETDKIRNYLLAHESTDNQYNYYHRYWQPIERNTRHQLAPFFRDFLAGKQNQHPKQAHLYRTFVTYYQEKVSDKASFFEELLLFSKRPINNRKRKKVNV